MALGLGCLVRKDIPESTLSLSLLPSSLRLHPPTHQPGSFLPCFGTEVLATRGGQVNLTPGTYEYMWIITVVVSCTWRRVNKPFFVGDWDPEVTRS